MKIQAIVASAGVGTRLGREVAKPFVSVLGKPLVTYALKVLADCPSVDSLVIVVETTALDEMGRIVRDHGIDKVKHIIAGGRVRGESVKNALAVLDDDAEYVLIHDGARPLITVEFVERMIEAAKGKEAMIAAVPVKPTIKQVDARTLCVEKTLDRSCLWDVQTPQIFQRDVLEKAYRSPDINVTDDAALVEQLGRPVKVFPGLEQNIKVTTPHDLFLIEKFLEV
jgi:2-C-methyl-D-erythritol 4-phosphate cytidylyltransferase